MRKNAERRAKTADEKNVQAFNRDVDQGEGYRYTRADRISATMANGRISDCVAALADFRNKRVMDLGCGDGTYTQEFLALGVREIVGADAADVAVREANRRFEGDRRIRFKVLDVYKARAPKKRYDIMVVRGLLHHLYDVEHAIAALAPLAKTIIVVEPNGYNPVLKVIEKTSKYHIEHEEKSYPPHKLNAWFEKAGGRVVKSTYIGLVPFFFPDAGVRFLKVLEPLFEKIPLIKQLSCAQYVQCIEMPELGRQEESSKREEGRRKEKER